MPKPPSKSKTRKKRSGVGLSSVSPSKRPSVSPREYQATLDLLRLRDHLWARMKPCEIARKMGKNKAWVSRAIKQLEEDRATAYCAPEERALVGDNLAQLESLVSKALALVDSEKDAKGRLAAIRTAADVIRQRADYQMAIGHVQQRDGKLEHHESPAEAFVAQLAADYTPDTVYGIHKTLREARQKAARFKLPYSNNHPS